jgi:hypothetical protein
MSQTQFIEYRDNGFWAYDVALGIFLKYLIDAAIPRSTEAGGEWLAEEIKEWRHIAVISDFGLDINPDWSSTHIATFIALVEQACSTLAGRTSISADEITAWPILDDLHIFTRDATEVATGPIIELGRAIIALIYGALPKAEPGKAWFYGTAEGRDTINMNW